MAAPRANSEALRVCRPAKDHYDGNVLVLPHFSYTPDLVPVGLAYKCHGKPEQDEVWAPIAHDIGYKARRLYEKHHFYVHNSTKAGLYLAGSHEDLEDLERDRMMVLVFELETRDSHRWRNIDEDARALLEDLQKAREGEHGVCVRYYLRHQGRGPSGGDRATQSLHNNQDLLSTEDLIETGYPSAARSLYSTQGLLPTIPSNDMDYSSVRSLPRVRLPVHDTRPGPRGARRTTNTDSRTELARQRREDRHRHRAGADLFREDSNELFEPLRGEIADFDDEVGSGLDSSLDFHVTSPRRPLSDVQQYRSLAIAIEEHQRRQTEFIHTLAHDIAYDAGHDDSWSDDTADEQARQWNYGDAGDPLAGTSRAVGLLRSMTRRDHEREFGERNN